MFAQMVEQMLPLYECGQLHITQQQYDDWKYGYTFEAMKGVVYGQSFCQHFGLVDYILRFCNNIDQADVYIKQTYIR